MKKAARNQRGPETAPSPVPVHSLVLRKSGVCAPHIARQPRFCSDILLMMRIITGQKLPFPITVCAICKESSSEAPTNRFRRTAALSAPKSSNSSDSNWAPERPRTTAEELRDREEANEACCQAVTNFSSTGVIAYA